MLNIPFLSAKGGREDENENMPQLLLQEDHFINKYIFKYPPCNMKQWNATLIFTTKE